MESTTPLVRGAGADTVRAPAWRRDSAVGLTGIGEDRLAHSLARAEQIQCAEQEWCAWFGADHGRAKKGPPGVVVAERPPVQLTTRVFVSEIGATPARAASSVSGCGTLLWSSP
jgi:hypothetical protein